jgi:diguanylate cyclase (GGDEF)-like protein
MTASKNPKHVKKTLQADAVDETLQRERERIRASTCNVLVVIAGLEVGQRVVVDRTVTIGRHPDCALILSDPLISSFHARVEDRGDSWTLVDLGSTNGTRVNGERATEVALDPGDKLGLGKTVIRYESQDHHEQQYAAQLERLLNKDDLSGLFVRRKFDSELARIVQGAAASGASVSLLVMDLDGIKKINDTHGHLFGAFVIGESGKLIGEVIGLRGFACRFGGDEFLAALPGLGVDAAAVVAEEIRAAINGHHFERSGIVLEPGISIGVATFPSHASEPVSLFEKGDEALYRAKGAGKNCVRTWLPLDTP